MTEPRVKQVESGIAAAAQAAAKVRQAARDAAQLAHADLADTAKQNAAAQGADGSE